MATQSPGIYFKEFDNTAFTNPKSSTGTVVCVVGYAKKGPIGEPIKITSWSDFTSTFGAPVEGYYSGLAVKNVLNSGGVVLFERVADNTASPSNYVVKNPIAGTKGHVKFARATDILVGTAGYVNGSIYAVKALDADKNEKIFYIRTPNEGKLTQNSIYSQMLNQNAEEGTAGTFEAVVNTNIASGLFSYKVEGTGIPEMDEVFVNLVPSNSGPLFAEVIKKGLQTGSNAISILRLSDSDTGEGGVISPSSTIGAKIAGTKKFRLVSNGNSNVLELQFVATDTYETLATKLDTKCQAFGVRAFLKQIDDTLNLVFVSLNKGEGQTLSIESLRQEEINVKVDETGKVTESNNLFISSNFDNDDGTSKISGMVAPGSTSKNSEKVSVCVFTRTDKANSVSALENFTVSYSEDTGSIVLSTTETGKGATIKMSEGELGKFILEGNTNIIGSVDGQDFLNVAIKRGTDKKIFLESIDSLSAPDLELVNDEKYKELLTIQKDPADPNSIGKEEPKDGTDTVDAANRDMVVFTSKEKGSATNNIVIEVYTSKSPIDGTVKHDLTVTVDGLLKETYEDISYDYADVDNRFDTKINEAVENGGSSYITCTVVKNDYQDPEVQLPDGVFKIGQANNADEIKKEPDVSYSAYGLYDYTLGTDGIPKEEGSALFEDAMKAGTSKLANRELYDFHVLITPDDISEVVQTAAIELCEDRGDSIAIIDPPIGLGVDEVINWHNGRGYGRATAPTSNYAATYWPWCKIYDNTSGSGKYTWVMPSVVMAAKYVSVDKSAGCWYAPAGETNGQLAVYDIEQYPNKLDRDALYVDYNRINPITKFKDGSIVVYGEKTLQRVNSVLTKIHTRRMLVQIKKRCREALRGYIFMPNSTEYLGKISSNMSAILETYKAGGGISTYKVVCDETNNPMEVRQQDIVNVDVVIVPNGTIEAINISLTLNKSEESISG